MSTWLASRNLFPARLRLLSPLRLRVLRVPGQQEPQVILSVVTAAAAAAATAASLHRRRLQQQLKQVLLRWPQPRFSVWNASRIGVSLAQYIGAASAMHGHAVGTVLAWQVLVSLSWRSRCSDCENVNENDPGGELSKWRYQKDRNPGSECSLVGALEFVQSVQSATTSLTT
jgi:hypothetical protein